MKIDGSGEVLDYDTTIDMFQARGGGSGLFRLKRLRIIYPDECYQSSFPNKRDSFSERGCWYQRCSDLFYDCFTSSLSNRYNVIARQPINTCSMCSMCICVCIFIRKQLIMTLLVVSLLQLISFIFLFSVAYVLH